MALPHSAKMGGNWCIRSHKAYPFGTCSFLKGSDRTKSSRFSLLQKHAYVQRHA